MGPNWAPMGPRWAPWATMSPNGPQWAPVGRNETPMGPMGPNLKKYGKIGVGIGGVAKPLKILQLSRSWQYEFSLGPNVALKRSRTFSPTHKKSAALAA